MGWPHGVSFVPVARLDLTFFASCDRDSTVYSFAPVRKALPNPCYATCYAGHVSCRLYLATMYMWFLTLGTDRCTTSLPCLYLSTLDSPRRLTLEAQLSQTDATGELFRLRLRFQTIFYNSVCGLVMGFVLFVCQDLVMSSGASNFGKRD